MGCSACSGKAAISNDTAGMVSTNYRVEAKANAGPCEYGNSDFQNWYDKLIWFKDRGLYVQHNIAASTINKYLGILLTSININNKCTYQNDFPEIIDVVSLIVTLQL